jgi:hypothetical protein
LTTLSLYGPITVHHRCPAGGVDANRKTPEARLPGAFCDDTRTTSCLTETYVLFSILASVFLMKGAAREHRWRRRALRPVRARPIWC